MRRVREPFEKRMILSRESRTPAGFGLTHAKPPAIILLSAVKPAAVRFTPMKRVFLSTKVIKFS
jgi:hypothetical protein